MRAFLTVTVSVILILACGGCGGPEAGAAGPSPKASEALTEHAVSPSSAAPSDEPPSQRTTAVSTSAATKTPAATGTPAGTNDSCAEMCARTEALRCGAADRCTKLCLESMRDNPCPGSMAAFMRCATAEPAAHWECTEDGVAAVKDGYCDAEQRSVITCVASQP